MLLWRCSFACASRSAVAREFFSAASTATYVLIPRVTAATDARNTASISVRIPNSYRFFFNVDANDSIRLNKTSAPSFTGSPFLCTSSKKSPILSKTVKFSKPLKGVSRGTPEHKSHYGPTDLKYFFSLVIFGRPQNQGEGKLQDLSLPVISVENHFGKSEFLPVPQKIITRNLTSRAFPLKSSHQVSLPGRSVENHCRKSQFLSFRQRSFKEVSLLGLSPENHRRKSDFSSARSKIIAGSLDSRRFPRTSVREVRHFALSVQNHCRKSRFLRFASKIIPRSSTSGSFDRRSVQKVPVLDLFLESHRKKFHFSSFPSEIIVGSLKYLD
jgi:hypothetical protein